MSDSSKPPAISSLSGYDLSPGSDAEQEDFHKLTGNISGSDDEDSNASQPLSRTYSPVVHDDGPPVKKKVPVSGLVSAYHDDDDSDHEVHKSEEDEVTSVHSSTSQVILHQAAEDSPHLNQNSIEGEATASAPEPVIMADGIQLPPSPPGRCSRTILEKISKMHQKMKYSNFDLDAMIQHGKLFRNPSIYEKLIDMLDIDEKGTNYPPELYDPTIWGKGSFHDELMKQQDIEMEKRRREKKEKGKVEFISATKPSDSSTAAGKRKSKWDTGASATTAAPGNPPAVGSLIKKK